MKYNVMNTFKTEKTSKRRYIIKFSKHKNLKHEFSYYTKFKEKTDTALCLDFK